MTTRCLVALALLTLLAPGCSLARAVLGGDRGVDGGATGADGGTHTPDAFTPTPDGGVAPDVDASLDAAVIGPDAWTPPFDAGGCHHDNECPRDVDVDGTCTYASTCATSASAMSAHTHYTCEGTTCTAHVTMVPVACARSTDGTACGPAPTCSACSTSACGAAGTRSCTGPVCSGGACASITTTVACSTPDDMCGSVSPWSGCHYDVFRGRCVDTRTWGGCVGSTCVGGVGHTEVRDCSC